ncbi:MAG: SDR family oxidoreductase [Proteiniphilum sp.]|jgi:NAD(P)-dependent dehydrogenase (short-subunit alcohol dehydrogenase family)|nr:SDR family oxidoreductase [Proteiniphilum sp.]NCD15528.1 SDR family NAD(P)-dependent oxidoreductase [Bacteroidia bacterium]HHT34880.1 SDR family oxidoreductase [Bacteroidales bacterium]MDD2726725.1 SDR family oxidoreductase [Proteiniphilum sp.]MDD3333326.1 SDR family oxidoreductase [Proteiniphilum sp.]
MYELFNIEDKVIVITGGTGVLGSSMVEYLAAHGARVAVLARNKEKGDRLTAKVKAAGGEAMFLQTDVADEAVLKQNAHEIVGAWGQIDVLINGAGGNMPGATIGPNHNIFDLKMDEFRKVVDLNLMGTVIPSVVFAEYMVKQNRGNIINVSSASALRPLTRVAGYGAAKAAVTNFTRYLAGELATKFGESFRVNALCPGFFITEQNRALLTNPDGSYSDRGNTIIAHTPFRRFGNPDDLLGTLHYLVSDASRFVTGTVAIVDGGFDSFSI